MLQIVHFFINRPRSSFKLHFAACFSRCSGNKEKHQRIFYVCIVVLKGFSLKKKQKQKKKHQSILAFTKCRFLFFSLNSFEMIPVGAEERRDQHKQI